MEQLMKMGCGHFSCFRPQNQSKLKCFLLAILQFRTEPHTYFKFSYLFEINFGNLCNLHRFRSVFMLVFTKNKCKLNCLDLVRAGKHSKSEQ